MIRPNLILPRTRIVIPENARVYFLAGPISGGGDWQAEAIDYLRKHDSRAFIVCPKPYLKEHKHYRLGMQEDKNSLQIGEFTKAASWERYYLNIAAVQGCVLFWMGKEDKNNPRPDGEYGRDTKGELGEWRFRRKVQRNHLDEKVKQNVVFGLHPDFPGASVITTNHNDLFDGKEQLYNSLIETLDAAISMK